MSVAGTFCWQQATWHFVFAKSRWERLVPVARISPIRCQATQSKDSVSENRQKPSQVKCACRTLTRLIATGYTTRDSTVSKPVASSSSWFEYKRNSFVFVCHTHPGCITVTQENNAKPWTKGRIQWSCYLRHKLNKSARLVLSVKCDLIFGFRQRRTYF